MFFFMQDLIEAYKRCDNSLRLLKKMEIDLSTEEYDASKSKVIIKLIPDNDKKWMSYRDKPTSIVRI